MGHSVSEAAENILDKKFPVLDKGFLRLVDYLGSDDRIVQSARVSYKEGTKILRNDRGLIDYLLRNGHTSPFEQVVLTFHAKMPVFVARQWVRHRTARINEVSGRYSIMSDEFYVPEGGNIAFQSQDNKQGRQELPVDAHLQEQIQADLRNQQSEAYKAYSRLIELGLSRELARINLPLSLYTEWFWQIDLHNLFHFLQLRLDPHAQYEIRAYAEVLLNMAETVAPLAIANFRSHYLGGVFFTAAEQGLLGKLLGTVDTQATVDDNALSHLPENIRKAMEEMKMTQREQERLAIKLIWGKQT